MGALHAGHLYLIRQAVRDCDKTIVSIFVNPLQFGPSEDFESYPRDLQTDISLAEEAGCDAIFAPSVEAMYPEKIETTVSVSGPASGLCGDARPGHFDGVATVVAKLLNLVGPDRAYFGRKDAQQLAVVRRMVKDLNFPVEIVACPTIRDADGLALSSRNRYLVPEARQAALSLYRGLMRASNLAKSGETKAQTLESAVADEIRSEPLAQLEYAELRDATTIEKLDELPEDGEALLAVAARISNPGEDAGGARLIDNIFISVDRGKVTVDEGVIVAEATSSSEK